MVLLLHGTTRLRAEAIVRDGPNPSFQEPAGRESEDGFSCCVSGGPFFFGTPVDYACGKANAFPDEGGPAILEVDVPEYVVAAAENAWFPISQGIVQFDIGAGIEELQKIWPDLLKRITTPICP